MRPLTRWTGGFAGERDPAQPLLTTCFPEGRVELSGTTTGNWVAKSANLLVDGLGGPQRVGLLLPLHWQSVALVLAGVAAGAGVVVASRPEQLAGCEAALTLAEHADAALDAGVEEVLVVAGTPMGLPGPAVAAPLLDYAREVPGHADDWTGAAPREPRVHVGERTLEPSPHPRLGAADRVAVTGALPDVLESLLRVLAAGSALVLVPQPDAIDLSALVGAEGVTVSVGMQLPGVPVLDT